MKKKANFYLAIILRIQVPISMLFKCVKLVNECRLAYGITWLPKEANLQIGRFGPLSIAIFWVILPNPSTSHENFKLRILDEDETSWKTMSVFFPGYMYSSCSHESVENGSLFQDEFSLHLHLEAMVHPFFLRFHCS